MTFTRDYHQILRGPQMHRSCFSRLTLRQLLNAIVLLGAVLAPSTYGRAQTVVVDRTPGHVVNTFSPLFALGSTVDRVPSNATDMFFRPDQIKQVLSAGWGVISYRQNTDLFVQAWHWNPRGAWSDPAGKGYFTGDSNPTKEMIRHSYGYSLRHRGFTRNGGSEFDGFSRLDDGDLASYWKSNPYLSKEFTGEDDALYPQWAVIALDRKENIDAMDDQDKGAWKTFPSGIVADGKGGITTLRLGSASVATKYVRVWMTRSSN